MGHEADDVCPACGQAGLARSDPDGRGRRVCRLCRAEEPRPGDRVLYLVCTYPLLEGDGGPALGRLAEVAPAFSGEDAEAHLRGLMGRAPNYRWERATVRGLPGWAGTGGGPAVFHHVKRKVVVVRPDLPRPDGVSAEAAEVTVT